MSFLRQVDVKDGFVASAPEVALSAHDSLLQFVELVHAVEFDCFEFI